MKKRYAIVDIETTGGRAYRDRIMEIAIVLHDGTQVLDQWESLIDPCCTVPYHITQLTRISQDMLVDAPKFFEVARQIVEFTEGAIFVAHNVRFDYSFVREEFKRLGFTYSRRQLCTVRLSRKAFPGFQSYSLGKLTRRLGIKMTQHHRAMADTMATVELLELILKQEESEEQIADLVNLGIKESLLPKNISLDTLHALPEACGVYYFHDAKGQLVYVGKSINIKKRVAEHFSKVTEKARKLQEYVHDISYEITGSELIALLFESHEIKTQRPYVNRAQRVRHFPYATYVYKNEAGYRCFEVTKPLAKERKKLEIVAEYPKLRHAKQHLELVRNRFELCSKYCNLEAGTGFCFPYHLKQCRGACGAEETTRKYNNRVKKAINHLSTVFEQDFFVVDQGRSESEQSIIWVEEGEFKGFGYIDVGASVSDHSELKSCIKSYPSNPEVKRIIRQFLHKNPKVQVVRL